jgi:hypothetical protein
MQDGRIRKGGCVFPTSGTSFRLPVLPGFIAIIVVVVQGPLVRTVTHIMLLTTFLNCGITIREGVCACAHVGLGGAGVDILLLALRGKTAHGYGSRSPQITAFT